MASTPQLCPAPPAGAAPWSPDGRVPQCGPHTWSPDLGTSLDRASSVSSAEQRWAKYADAPAVPQWQPPPPIRTHPRALEQQQHAQHAHEQEQHAPQQRPRYLPRAKSGPSQVGGWYTSSDMAMKWMRPTKLARTASADSSRCFEPQLVSPIRKPGRPGNPQQFQSSVRQARPAPAATTIRVVSSDWTPEGFEKTVGVFAGGRHHPQWSPLLRRSSMHESASSHEGAAMALASFGSLRTTSHPPPGSFATGDADQAHFHSNPVGPRSSWPPPAHSPIYAGGGWAALGRGEAAVPEQHPRSLPRDGAAAYAPAPMPAPLPPVPSPGERRGPSKAAQAGPNAPHLWRASSSWSEGLHGAGLGGGNLDDWQLDELDVLSLAAGNNNNKGPHGGAAMVPRPPDYVDGHFAGPNGAFCLPDHAGGHAPVPNGAPRVPEYTDGHATSRGHGMPLMY